MHLGSLHFKLSSMALFDIQIAMVLSFIVSAAFCAVSDLFRKIRNFCHTIPRICGIESANLDRCKDMEPSRTSDKSAILAGETSMNCISGENESQFSALGVPELSVDLLHCCTEMVVKNVLTIPDETLQCTSLKGLKAAMSEPSAQGILHRCYTKANGRRLPESKKRTFEDDMKTKPKLLFRCGASNIVGGLNCSIRTRPHQGVVLCYLDMPRKSCIRNKAV